MKVYEITVPDYQRMVTKVEDKTSIMALLRQMLFGKDEFYPYDEPGELEQVDEEPAFVETSAGGGGEKS